MFAGFGQRLPLPGFRHVDYFSGNLNTTHIYLGAPPMRGHFVGSSGFLLSLFKNGSLLYYGTDYTIAGRVVTLTANALGTDKFVVDYVSQMRGGKTSMEASPSATWNPSDKSSVITLSGGNLIAAGSGAYGLARSTNPLSGKVYFELVYSHASNGTGGGGRDDAAGVCDASLNVTTGQAYTSNQALEVWIADGTCWTNGASVGFLSASSTTVRVAVDVPGRKVWVAPGTTTSWVLGGDPAAGTTPTATLSGSGSLYAFAEPFGNSVTVSLVAIAANMLNSPPSGFIAGF